VASGLPYVSRAALVEYLVDNVGKAHNTAVNMAAPNGIMMRQLMQNGFCRQHANGWLITE
jgi:hypothetical protein